MYEQVTDKDLDSLQQLADAADWPLVRQLVAMVKERDAKIARLQGEARA